MQATLRAIPKSLEEVMAYQHDRMISRYAMDHGGSNKEAEDCFIALKQFLIVCAVKPGKKVASRSIDNMWHTFLLFTRDYKAFCEEELGRFINHEPFENPSPHTFWETRAFAGELFGTLNERFWADDAKVDCTSGCED